ncbi:MAG: alpha/beta hydrolase, partial [Lysobacterales bacterium]
VVGLRIPGHGQAPSGLANVKWQDMAGAVRIALRHIHEKVPDHPLYIVGYSNGGALAVNYALESLADPSLPAVNGLILLSPEIGISKLAVFARTQARLGYVLGLDKLAWTDVTPDYDPWKYNSFATNAARQAYLITARIQDELSELEEGGKLAGMPPILAFQSAVDATVTAPALLDHLFKRLPPPASSSGPGWNEMVVIDINRNAYVNSMLDKDPLTWLQPMLNDRAQTFMLTLLTNRGDEDTNVVAILREPGSSDQQVCDIGLQWPDRVYSLSHIALPFPPDDPYYGGGPAGLNPVNNLGQLVLRGEKSVLHISADSMLRMHWNPFHAYFMGRIDAFTGLGPGPNQTCNTIQLPASG